MQRAALPLFLIVAVATAGWIYRQQIMILIKPPASATHPSENPDVLYTWVDENGVTHYSSQEPVKSAKSAKSAESAKRVEYDGAAITPMDPIDPVTAARLEVAAEAEEDKRRGSELLHAIRDEATRNQQIIQQVQESAAGI